jgi:hypothetical protein
MNPQIITLTLYHCKWVDKSKQDSGSVMKVQENRGSTINKSIFNVKKSINKK